MIRRRGRVAFLAPAQLLALASLAAILVLGLLLWNPQWGHTATPTTLKLYCAAGLSRPVEEVCRQYEAEYQVRIELDQAGSGDLLAKITAQQEPADLFLAADATFIAKGIKADVVRESIPVANIHPVIVVRSGFAKRMQSVDDLLANDVKVGLANPERTAIGRAVQAALTSSGQWVALQRQAETLPNKVSMLGTVNEVAMAVSKGYVDAGIVWDSTAAEFKLTVIEVKELKSQEEQITLGVLRGAKVPGRALHFARYLTARDRGLQIFARHRYTPAPDADVWADRPTPKIMAGAMLRPAIESLVEQFEQREGVKIDWQFAGCGTLVNAMDAGLRPAAYFSCDTSFMDKVQPLFLPPVDISRNDMLIIVKPGNPKKIHRLADLATPGLRIGLADARYSALGALTDNLLKREGLLGKVVAETRTDAGHTLVAQVIAGPLDAAIVYRSNALSHPGNSGRNLETVELGVPNAQATQPFAIGKDSDHKQLMRRLQTVLQSDQARQRFEELGFHWARGEAR